MRDEPYSPGTGATVSAALVTGAGKRIGRAIALSLGRKGWKVAVHFHGSRAEAEKVAAEIRAGGGAAMTLRADLSREDEVLPLLPQAEAALGPVTLLVNNGGINFNTPLFAIDSSDNARREMEVNYFGTLAMCRAFQPILKANGGGAIGPARRVKRTPKRVFPRRAT